MKKIASGSTLFALALLLAACTSNTTSTQGNLGDSSQSSLMMQASSSSDAGVTLIVSSASSAAAQSSASEQATKDSTTNVVAVNVENFDFAPNVIHLKKGQTSQIKLTGVSGNHGFAVPELGINVRVAQGDTVVVNIPTDKTGSFHAFCSVPCGPGHNAMQATIVID